jgi:O-antigen ligase
MSVGHSEFVPAYQISRAPVVAGQILNFVLFLTMVTSSLAFIEPSPHDVLMLLLCCACVIARVPFDRKLTPLLLLIAIWLVGGSMSLLEVVGDKEIHPDLHQDPVVYFMTSVYLGLAAIMFACLFSDGNLLHLKLLRRAYLTAAVCATIAGCIGFFHLVPHSDIFLALSDDGMAARVKATFKDPNVYGPFLVFPLLMLALRVLTEKITLGTIVLALILLVGLLLSFSRGAWAHLAVSAIVAIILCYLTAPNRRMQTRIVGFGLITIFAIAIALVALLSISSIHDMFLERAKLFQPYDTAGSGGRFALQRLALDSILDHPNGMGPYGFSNSVIGGQQHNVYMQAFLVDGWLGGAAYLAIVLLTFAIGLRYVFIRTPWQIYFIAAYGTFIGEIGEGIIIDTDHWRHFFLAVGLVWGLSVANINWQWKQKREAMLA